VGWIALAEYIQKIYLLYRNVQPLARYEPHKIWMPYVPNVVFFNSSSARISNNGRVRVQLKITLRQRAKHDCVTKVTEINSAMKL
jgi:hypothetical protein